MSGTKNIYTSRFDGFVQLHALLSDKNNQRVFPRRFNFPFKKKSNVAELSDLAYLFFKRSATNFFVTFFAHGKVMYSCSSGIVGLKKKQRRWSNAAFLIGAHFFTFLKHYFSVRSGTTVYRNKPLGNIIVVLRSPIYLFTIFYVSFSQNFKHMSSQFALRRVISYRAAYSDFVLKTRMKYKRTRVLRPLRRWHSLIRYLSGTDTCYSLYFKRNYSWLQHNKYYYSSTLRGHQIHTRILSAFLRSQHLVLSVSVPRSATLLDSFFSSYSIGKKRLHSTDIVHIEHDILRHFTSTLYSASSLVNASFFSFLGNVYFLSNNEAMLPWTPFLIDALNICATFFVPRYFNACTLFYILFFFFNSICSRIWQLKYRASSSYMLSSFYFTIFNTFMLPTINVEPPASRIFLRDYKVHIEWAALYNSLFVINGIIYVSYFRSIYYNALCLLLRSCATTTKIHYDIYALFYIGYLSELSLHKRFLFNITSVLHSIQPAIIRLLPNTIYSFLSQLTNARNTYFSNCSHTFFPYASHDSNHHVVNAFGSVLNSTSISVITFQLRTHRVKHGTGYLRRAYSMLMHSTSALYSSRCIAFPRIVSYRRSSSFTASFLTNYFFISKLLVMWSCGYNTLTSTLFTRVMSSLYTVSLKSAKLVLLSNKFFAYSFFINRGFKSLSFLYFLSFFISFFFMRGWTAYFKNTILFSCSRINKTKAVLGSIQSNFLCDSNDVLLSRVSASMSFNIFMFVDQSSFPFNGCKGKKKS